MLARLFRTSARGAPAISTSPISGCRRSRCSSRRARRFSPTSAGWRRGMAAPTARPCSGSAEFPATIPIRGVLDEADPALLQPCFEQMETRLAEPPMRQTFGRLGGRTLIAWDGTEYFCSRKLGCPNCLTRKRSNGKIENCHCLLSATVVAPGHSKDGDHGRESEANVPPRPRLTGARLAGRSVESSRSRSTKDLQARARPNRASMSRRALYIRLTYVQQRPKRHRNKAQSSSVRQAARLRAIPRVSTCMGTKREHRSAVCQARTDQHCRPRVFIVCAGGLIIIRRADAQTKRPFQSKWV